MQSLGNCGVFSDCRLRPVGLSPSTIDRRRRYILFAPQHAANAWPFVPVVVPQSRLVRDAFVEFVCVLFFARVNNLVNVPSGAAKSCHSAAISERGATFRNIQTDCRNQNGLCSELFVLRNLHF